ncbi:unnamed protein product [Closterium sp. NIES-53]
MGEGVEEGERDEAGKGQRGGGAIAHESDRAWHGQAGREGARRGVRSRGVGRAGRGEGGGRGGRRGGGGGRGSCGSDGGSDRCARGRNDTAGRTDEYGGGRGGEESGHVWRHTWEQPQVGEVGRRVCARTWCAHVPGVRGSWGTETPPAPVAALPTCSSPFSSALPALSLPPLSPPTPPVSLDPLRLPLRHTPTPISPPLLPPHLHLPRLLPRPHSPSLPLPLSQCLPHIPLPGCQQPFPLRCPRPPHRPPLPRAPAPPPHTTCHPRGGTGTAVPHSPPTLPVSLLSPPPHHPSLALPLLRLPRAVPLRSFRLYRSAPRWPFLPLEPLQFRHERPLPLKAPPPVCPRGASAAAASAAEDSPRSLPPPPRALRAPPRSPGRVPPEAARPLPPAWRAARPTAPRARPLAAARRPL